MEPISVLWILVGLAVLVLGPAGGVWAGMRQSVRSIGERIDTMVEHWETDREDTREWLKALQIKTDSNATDIAVLKDRTDRE